PYMKIKRHWYFLYRPVDSTAATLDFMLSQTRDAGAPEHFFRQLLQASHTPTLRVITVDQNAAYPPAFEVLSRRECSRRPVCLEKRRGGELTRPEKAANRLIASIRIRIEHAIGGVKRYRMVKDKIRLLTDGIRDTHHENLLWVA